MKPIDLDADYMMDDTFRPKSGNLPPTPKPAKRVPDDSVPAEDDSQRTGEDRPTVEPEYSYNTEGSGSVFAGCAKGSRPRWKQLTEDTRPSAVTVTKPDGSVEIRPADP